MVGTKRKRGEKGGGRARRSRYVGVCWNKRDQKWEAAIQVRGVNQYLGYFDDEADGARVYDAAMAAKNLRYHPRNFPGDTGAEQTVKQAKNRDNRSAIPEKCKSSFFGVTWHKQKKKWEVRTRTKGQGRPEQEHSRTKLFPSMCKNMFQNTRTCSGTLF